jgi:hypothetical protein
MELVVGAAERPLLIEQARQLFLHPRTDRAMLEDLVDLVRRTGR